MEGETERDGDSTGNTSSAAGFDGKQRLMSHLNGYSAIALLSLGHRSGLLAALLEGGGTATEIANRAGTHERSTEEWLAGLTAAGYAHHDDGVFTLVEGRDEVFRPGLLPFDVTILLEVKDKFASLMGQVVDSLRDGKGVPYAACQPEFSAAQDRLNGHRRPRRGRGRRVAPSSVDRDDDLAAGVLNLHMTYRRCGVIQREGPIHHRQEAPRDHHRRHPL
jgi:hypothetical protein